MRFKLERQSVMLECTFVGCFVALVNCEPYAYKPPVSGLSASDVQPCVLRVSAALSVSPGSVLLGDHPLVAFPWQQVQ